MPIAAQAATIERTTYAANERSINIEVCLVLKPAFRACCRCVDVCVRNAGEAFVFVACVAAPVEVLWQPGDALSSEKKKKITHLVVLYRIIHLNHVVSFSFTPLLTHHFTPSSLKCCERKFAATPATMSFAKMVKEHEKRKVMHQKVSALPSISSPHPLAPLSLSLSLSLVNATPHKTAKIKTNNSTVKHEQTERTWTR
jgi:hypothetical protein